MSLRFYQLLDGQQTDKAFDNLDTKSVLKQKQEEQTFIVSLIDLKPQQLPIPHRKFIPSQPYNAVKGQENGNFVQKEQEQLYSNMEWMLWVSEPIQISNIQWLKQQTHHINANKHNLVQKNKVYVRYLYLPPLSQYMKHYGQRLKQLNLTQTNNSNASTQQLSHQTQLVIEQRHQVMYCLARELSSAVVFEFGSKYIRFDYLSFQDYKHAVFQKISTQDQLSIKNGPKGSICENEEVPHYLVIKSSNYSSERDFQVYKVKLYNNTNLSNSLALSSRNQSSSLNISVEIESKSIVSIKKTHNSQTNEQKFKQLVEMSVNLLKLTQNKINTPNKSQKQNKQSEGKQHDNQTFSTENSQLKDNSIHDKNEESSSNIENEKIGQIEEDKKIWISKQSIKWIKPLHYNFFLRILRYYCGNEVCVKEKLQKKIGKRINKATVSKEIIDKTMCYYLHSINMMKKLSLIKQSHKESLRREVLRQIMTEIMFVNNHSEYQNEIPQNQSIMKGISFELMQELQKFMVDYLREHSLIECIEKQQLNSLHNEKRLCELIKTIKSSRQLSINDVQMNFIEQIYSNLSEFVDGHLINLMRNQCLGLINKQYYSYNNQVNDKPSGTQLTFAHKSKTIVPILNIQIPTQIKQNLSQKLYSILSNKLSSYHLNHPSYFPLIFSYPLQSHYLKTTISSKDSHIHQLNQQIGILQVQLSEKQSIIYNQQSQISKYKLEEVFYKQVLNQLNQVQVQLNHQIEIKKKLTIDIQCAQILKLQANETIQTQQLKQSLLLQEKQNFFQAISHLSKQNQHYITLSQKLQSTIDSLNKKIDHYQFIDIQINSLNLQNQQLKQQNQFIKSWKATVQQSHKDLMLKQIHKFNHVLKINFQKFTQTKKQLDEMKDHFKSLHCQLQTQTKNNLILQEQIHYLKSKYFHSNHITIDYSHSDNPILNSVALH